VLNNNLLKSVLATGAIFAFCGLAMAEDIELVSGEVITGNVIERGSSMTIIDHPILGVLSIDNSKVKSIVETGAVKLKLGGGAAAAAVAPAASAAAGKAPAKKAEKPLWAYEAEFGASGSTGNSEVLNLHAAVGGKSDNEDRRWTFGAQYNQTKSEGDRTKNNFNVQSQYDFKLQDSKWFPFARVRWDWDEFSDWDSRLQVGAGAGRELIKKENYELLGRVGLNAVREFSGADDSWRLEAMLGADVDWQINKTQKLVTSITVFPDLEDQGEYRALLTAGWSVVLDEESSMNLKIGIENEFDSHQGKAFEKNNFRYYIALAFKF